MKQTDNKLIDCYTLVAKALKKQDVDNIYGIIGIPVTQLASSAQEAGIRYIGFRNEQAASYAAGAAGYLTGKPGVCLTVSGPGFIHGIAGLANATANCFPMILISGSADREKTGLQQGDFQELDQTEAARPFAKAVYKINSIASIGTGVARAIRTACSGRPGGVYLDLPADILHQTAAANDVDSIIGEKICPAAAPVPPEADLESAIGLITSAERPLLVIGKGAAYSRAEKEILTFTERNNIPFISAPMAKGLLPDSHRLSANSCRSAAMKGADTVLVAGARLNWIMSHGQPPKWSDTCRFIQIDIHPEEFDSNARIALALTGDIKETFRKINTLSGKSPVQPKTDWLNMLEERKSRNKSKMESALLEIKDPMDFKTAFSVIRNAIRENPETVLVTEGANTLDIGRGILDMELPRKRLDSGTWGTMGIGMGYAIAAATTTSCPVLAVVGDSAFGFSAMEIETICRYQLPVVTVIFNNGGIYKGDSINIYNSDPSPTKFVDNCRYENIMEAFGGEGARVETQEELNKALKKACASSSPFLINCLIDPTAGTESGHMTSKN